MVLFSVKKRNFVPGFFCFVNISKTSFIVWRILKLFFIVVSSNTIELLNWIYDEECLRAFASALFFSTCFNSFTFLCLLLSLMTHSWCLFIYSQKHVQQLFFHHVTPVFHPRMRRDISSMNIRPLGMFILDETLLALELMTFIMLYWRVEHECLVSFTFIYIYSKFLLVEPFIFPVFVILTSLVQVLMAGGFSKWENEKL